VRHSGRPVVTSTDWWSLQCINTHSRCSQGCYRLMGHQQLGHNLNANVTAPGESSRQRIRLDRSGQACKMHDAWPALVQVAVTPHISVHTKGDAKTSQMAWIQDIRASGIRLALHLLTTIIAPGLCTLLWEVLSVVAKLGFRTPSLVGTGVTRTRTYTNYNARDYATYQTENCPNHQHVRSAVASVFRKRSRTGDTPADDQAGCLITGNAADLPGCPPPPGMELN
jgi:hypothetical protein